MHLHNIILAGFAFATAAFAVGPGPAVVTDVPYQVRYAARLAHGESYIDIANGGANGASLNGSGFGAATGNICANLYAFDANEEMVSCCSCLITPDSTIQLGVNNDLLSNTTTGEPVSSVTIKLVATLAGTGGSGSSCTQSAANLTTETIPAAGVAAWGTTLHEQGAGYATTETPFTPATLGSAEEASLANRCTFIIGTLSGFGVCTSCRIHITF